MSNSASISAQAIVSGVRAAYQKQMMSDVMIATRSVDALKNALEQNNQDWVLLRMRLVSSDINALDRSARGYFRGQPERLAKLDELIGKSIQLSQGLNEGRTSFAAALELAKELDIELCLLGLS
ncbi:MAG TPA: hypothetical protein V6C81_29355 [Planktothrix sp.]|jgi:hypothetical protein